MAWVNVYNAVRYPSTYGNQASSSLRLASGVRDRLAYTIRSPRQATLTAVLIRLATVTTGETLLVSLQDLDGSGYPDGVVLQSGTTAVANTDDNTNKTVTLDTPRNLSVGEQFAVVVEWDSAVGDLFLGYGGSGDYGQPVLSELSSTWSHVTGSSPHLGLDWSDGAHVTLPYRLQAPTANLSLGAVDAEAGNRLIFPFTGVVNGYHYYNNYGGAGANAHVVRLYDSASNVIAQSATVQWHLPGTWGWQYGWFPRPAMVTKGLVYRMVLRTVNFSAGTPGIDADVMPTQARLAALPDGSDAECYQTARATGTGAWTDTTTRRAIIGAQFSMIDDGSGPTAAGWMPQGTILQDGPPVILPG